MNFRTIVIFDIYKRLYSIFDFFPMRLFADDTPLTASAKTID